MYVCFAMGATLCCGGFIVDYRAYHPKEVTFVECNFMAKQDLALSKELVYQQIATRSFQ